MAGVVAVVVLLWPLTTWYPSVPISGFGYQPEEVGEVAAGIRCPDTACRGMSLEEAIMRSAKRYPNAYRWWILIEERLARGGTVESVRSYFGTKFGRRS